MPDHLQSRVTDQHPGKAKTGFGLGSVLLILLVVGVIAAILLLT